MRLLKMQKVEEYGEPVIPDGYEYTVKLETKAEWRIRENFTCYGADKSALDSMIRSCDSEACIMGDNDIIYYFGVLEHEPEVGETFELDKIVWERVA